MDQPLPVARRHPIAGTFRPGDFLPSFAVIWRRRELLWSLTGRNIRNQYKQSMLGYAWIFVNPLTQIVTLTFVFSTILRITSLGIPFPLFLFSGLALTTWGVGFGIWVAIGSLGPEAATTGTVMLAVLPFLMGFQLLLAAFVLDILSEPK